MTSSISAAAPHEDPERFDLEIVLPVYNEERALPHAVARLTAYLSESFPFSWRLLIADNGSTDCTPQIARATASTYPNVTVLGLETKGRGFALKTAWSASTARVLCYMDVDLSTGLEALLPLVAPLLAGHSAVAIGTRLARGSRVERCRKRETISRAYNRLLRLLLRARFTDAQCGFKALRQDAAQALLPSIEDSRWFFDTELLIAAQRAGMRIHEVPVDWVEDPDSRVDILSTALADLRGVARLAFRRRPAAQRRSAPNPFAVPAVIAGARPQPPPVERVH